MNNQENKPIETLSVILPIRWKPSEVKKIDKNRKKKTRSDYIRKKTLTEQGKNKT